MRGRNIVRAIWAAWVCLLMSPSAYAQVNETPAAVDGLDIEEHLNEQLPLDTRFTDHTGNVIRLGDIFDGKRPVILSLNYSNCPMLCQLQLNSLVATLGEMDLVLASHSRSYRSASIPTKLLNEPRQHANGITKNTGEKEPVVDGTSW